MKRCPYCGREYSDAYSVCATDENPLESCDPKPSKPHGAVAASKSTGQHTKAVWISGASVIASIAIFFIWGLASGVSGGFGVLAILGCFMAVKLIFFASAIAFIVQGFRMHWGWGVANLFLFPLAGVVFFIRHRQKGSVPIYILVHGLMLLLVVLAIVAASGLMGSNGMGPAMVARARNEAATSQVVGYASTDRITTTNIFLRVTEIWKGSEQASKLGITNGVVFPEDGDHLGGSPPEGAIFILSVNTNRQTSDEEIIWVRSGQVEHMTVQEFKAEIGL